MRKYIALIIGFGFCAAGATITTTAALPSYTAGDSVFVDIAISGVSDLYAFQFDLSFEPSILLVQYVVQQGYFLSNGVAFFSGSIDNASGTVSFIADSLSGLSPGFTGDTLLATANFVALAPGTTAVSVNNIVLLDSNVLDITATTAGGAIVNVVPLVALPEPSTLRIGGVTLCALLVASRRRLGPIIGTQHTLQRRRLPSQSS